MLIKKRNKANAILEYGAIIAIVAAVMMGMHHIIRRGAQANIKRLTDSGIGQYSSKKYLTESDEEEHIRVDIDTTLKKESIGGATLTTITDDDAFYNYNNPGDKDVGMILDVVDYAIKPVGFAYPDAQYILWDMHWARIE